MPDFDARMNQLLDALGDMAPGHRERLLRRVRQHDIECWPADASGEAVDAMKAAMRVAVHELLDEFCFQLEAVLTRAHDDATRVFVLALVSVAMHDGICVAFRDQQTTTGITRSGCEKLVIDVLSGSRLQVDYSMAESRGSPQSLVAGEEIALDATDENDDPFALARALIDRLRSRE
jgi:hypothetical protein